MLAFLDECEIKEVMAWYTFHFSFFNFYHYASLALRRHIFIASALESDWILEKYDYQCNNFVYLPTIVLLYLHGVARLCTQRGQNFFKVTRISQYVLLINLIFKGGCREESQTKCGEQGGSMFVQTFWE